MVGFGRRAGQRGTAGDSGREGRWELNGAEGVPTGVGADGAGIGAEWADEPAVGNAAAPALLRALDTAARQRPGGRPAATGDGARRRRGQP